MTETPVEPAARTFRPGIVLALILAAVFSLSAIGVLGAYAPELERGDNGGDHALSRSAIGYAGVVKLLRGLDRSVLVSRGATGAGGPDSLLVLTPPPEPDDETLHRLLDRDTSILVVLPKWAAVPDPMRKGWVRRAGVLPPAQSLSALPDDLAETLSLKVAGQPETGAAQREPRNPFSAGAGAEGPRSLSGQGWLPVATDARGDAVVVQHEATGVYVLADPDLLNTHSLNKAEKARAAVALLDSLHPSAGGVVFDVSLHGFARPRSVMRLLLEPPLLGFTLCLAFAVGLVGWQAMVRFVPHLDVRRAVALGKKALADNTAALVRLARREHRMATPYAELVRAQAAKAVAAPPNLSDEALTALLDRLAARDGVEHTYAALSAEADKAKNAGDLMAVARALNRWKSEMTRGRG